MSISLAGNSANQNVAVNSPLNGPGGSGGLLTTQKDATESSTAPKFGELLNKMQAQYGAKAEKPREIKKTLGKDDFLRIMITQMRHQDPTNPFKAEQMAQEMAQFTSVEQMQNINQNLQKMATANQPLERLAMTNMIGKTVTIDRDRFPHAEGAKEALSYTLPKDAGEVKIALISDAGETVLEKDLGPTKAGGQSFDWDGMKSNSLPAKPGNYMFRIEAKDEQGVPIQLDSQHQSRVVGVSFEGSEPVFLVGDNVHQDKVLMKNIVRVDSAGDATPMGTSASGAQPGVLPPAGAKGPSFFTFQKGAGSMPIEAGFHPETAKALDAFEKQKSGSSDSSAPQEGRKAEEAARAQAQAAYAEALKQDQARAKLNEAGQLRAEGGPKVSMAPAEGKGFPNGLSDK